MNFTVGQLVRLISGSPEMVVIATNPSTSTITVAWVFNIQSNSLELPAVCFVGVQ